MPEVITIKLTPSARKNAVLGWEADSEGSPVLKVQVTTVPEKGKANKALIELLAKHWKIPKSAITIIRGETSRIKTLEIQGVVMEGLTGGLPSAS